jgi:hypothetical protein
MFILCNFAFVLFTLDVMFCIILSWRHNRQRPSLLYMCIRKITFCIIKQIVHAVEGNIKNFQPSKNHCQPRLTPRLTMVLSDWEFLILPSTTWAIYIVLTCGAHDPYWWISDTHMCGNCNNLTEDAYHYFFICSKYATSRKLLIQSIQNVTGTDYQPDLDLLLYGSSNHEFDSNI